MLKKEKLVYKKPLPISPFRNFTTETYMNRGGFDQTVNQIPK